MNRVEGTAREGNVAFAGVQKDTSVMDRGNGSIGVVERYEDDDDGD